MSLSDGSSHSHSPTITPQSHMAPTEFSTDLAKVADGTADCVGRDLTANTQIHVQLDVDSSVTGTSFVDTLAQSIASFGDAHFSLCKNPGNGRLLLISTSSQQELSNVTVTGLDATASTVDEVCTPAEQGAYCTVVDLVLTVYSASEEATSAAEQQVYDDVLVKQLEAGTFVSDGIIAIRFHPKDNYPTDSSVVSRDGYQQAPASGAQDSSAVRTIVTSVLVLVAVTVLVGLVYRKRMANQRGINSGSEDDSKYDSNSSIADDGAVPALLRAAVEDGPISV